MFHEPALQGKSSRNQDPAAVYFYSAAKPRSRGALWPIFTPALITTTFQEFSIQLSTEDRPALDRYYCGEAIKGLRSCKLASTLETNYWFVDDKLASITVNFISASHLTDFVEGLTKKFGLPTKSDASYQNGFGASRNGRVWTWKSASGGITLAEIGQNVDLGTGTLSFYDSKLRNEFLDRFDPKPKL